MVPNVSLHTIKVGVGLVSRPVAAPHWLLGPWAATPGRRLAQGIVLIGALVMLATWLIGFDKLIS